MRNSEKQSGSKYENNEPFLGKLKRIEFSSHLRELESNPKRIVRSVNIRNLSSSYEHARGIVSGIESAITAKKMLEELKTKYRFPIPLVDIIIGKRNNDDEVQAYIITEKIDGKNLADIMYSDSGEISRGNTSPKEQSRIFNELDMAFAGLVDYVRDKYNSKNFYFSDMNFLDQFMWGKREKDDEPHLYMIDTDVQYIIRPNIDLELFISGLSQLFRLGKNYKINFLQTRKKSKEFMRFLKDKKDTYNAELLQKNL